MTRCQSEGKVYEEYGKSTAEAAGIGECRLQACVSEPQVLRRSAASIAQECRKRCAEVPQRCVEEPQRCVEEPQALC